MHHHARSAAESLVHHLTCLWQSTRAWAFVGALCTRGVGFIASFSLARFAGAESLALYVTTVVTAAAVANPLAQVLFNGGTLVATVAPSAAWARRLVWASAWMALAWLPVLVLLYRWMYAQLGDAHVHLGSVALPWLLLAGVSSVVGQIFGFAFTGLLNGFGAQLPAARLTALLAAALMPLSLPCVYAYGLQGALAMLVLGSLLPLWMQLWLLSRWLRDAWQAREGHLCDESELPWRALSRQVGAGLPNAISLVATGAGSWFCTIYMVQKFQGSAAVALLAVVTQWTTLVLMPATSWGGVVLRELAHRRLSPDGHRAVWAHLWRLMQRNVMVTAALAAAVLLAWHWIELGYRLQAKGMYMLMLVSAVAAVVSAANGVLERALIAWQKQWHLMMFAFAGLLAQTVFTVAFVRTDLVAVQWGLVLSTLLTGGLSLWFLRLTVMTKGKA